MNRLLKFIYVKIGWACPICGDWLLSWRGCSHTPACDYCPTCFYKNVYKGVSVTSLEFPILERCKCGGQYTRYMFAGETVDTCSSCGEVKK